MPDLEPHKRKRDVDDHGRETGHHTQQIALQQGTSFQQIADSWMGFPAGRVPSAPLCHITSASRQTGQGEETNGPFHTLLQNATLGIDEERTQRVEFAWA